jgi:NAD(P)-dependent dehydrogenase (short-subunit alcohol dehydrogenase family)
MRVLIIGATGGIGEALARQVAGRAEQLWLHGRNAEALRALAWELRAHPIVADLGSEEAVRAMMSQAGPIDRLIYAAGAVARQALREHDEPTWHAVWTANFEGARRVLRFAQWQPRARALFLGVYPDYVRVPGLGAYATSKAALEELLGVARKEWRAEGIRFILARLPAVRTPLWNPLGSPPRNALEPDAIAARLWELLEQEDVPDVISL